MQINYFGNQYEFISDKPIVLIAGGIGITVFRSYLKKMIDLKMKPKITLLYINRTSYAPFKEEIELWKNSLPLHTIYWETEKQGRMTEVNFLSMLPKDREKNTEYYIAGPPFMVDGTTELLEKLTIDSRKIHTDSFDGYVEG
jgi:ferredoxin-NADP reductase